jgi:hypothetical protein
MLRSLASKKQLLDLALLAKRATGKSILMQLLEIITLRRGYGELFAFEYYDFKLYDDRKFPDAKKHEFLGTRTETKVCQAVNSIHWDMIEEDKLMTYAVLTGIGLPVPRTFAVYHRGGRYFAPAVTVTTPENLADYLRNGAPYPLFAKPAHSSFGCGGFALGSLDRPADRLHMVDGTSAQVDAFVAGLDHVGGRNTIANGYIFQELLAPHPIIRQACGTISSVRLLVLLHDDGPRIFRAVWKVPRKASMTDNFHHGVSGNMLAWIDVETGSVQRVIRGMGREREDVTTHPDTGERLMGLRLPDWETLLKVGLEASAALPKLRFLHFDIAMTDRGPVIFEINVEGSFDLVQLPAPAGLYDETLRTFLARYATDPAVRRVHEKAVRRLGNGVPPGA